MSGIPNFMVLAVLALHGAALAQEEEGGLGGMDIGDEAFQESPAGESEEAAGEAAEGPESEASEESVLDSGEVDAMAWLPKLSATDPESMSFSQALSPSLSCPHSNGMDRLCALILLSTAGELCSSLAL